VTGKPDQYAEAREMSVFKQENETMKGRMQMNKNKKVTAVAVAKVFCQLIRAELGDKMQDVVARNRGESDSDVCHTHDYCDANMVMASAMRAVGIPCSSNELWNSSWDIAKAAEFKLDLGAEQPRG